MSPKKAVAKNVPAPKKWPGERDPPDGANPLVQAKRAALLHQLDADAAAGTQDRNRKSDGDHGLEGGERKLSRRRRNHKSVDSDKASHKSIAPAYALELDWPSRPPRCAMMLLHDQKHLGASEIATPMSRANPAGPGKP